MGADIHVVVEQQDTKGQWWAIFDSDVLWSGWWAQHSGFSPRTQHVSSDPNGFMGVRRQSYYLFGCLSGVRRPNLLHPYGVGGPEGILPAQTDFACNPDGWPLDASSYAQHFLHNTDHHSFGAIRFDRLQDLRARLEAGDGTGILTGFQHDLFAAISTEYREDGGYNSLSNADLIGMLEDEAPKAVQSLLVWCLDVERALETLLGDGGTRSALFSRPLLQQLDDDRYDDVDAPVLEPDPHNGVSAHSLLTFLADKQAERGLPSVDPTRLRLLVCYDN